MKAGPATHASTTHATQPTGAEPPVASPRESFAMSLAQSLAPTFETVVRVELPTEKGSSDRRIRGDGARSDATTEVSAGKERDTLVPPTDDQESIDAGGPERAVVAETRLRSGPESPSLNTDASQGATMAVTGERPALIDRATASSSPPGSSSTTGSTPGTTGDAGKDGATVAVARDPLGLMPQPEPVGERHAEARAAESGPTLSQMQEQRRAETRSNPPDGDVPSPGASGAMRGSLQTPGASAVMPGMVPGATSVASTTASSGGVRAGSQVPINGINGLSGLNGVGRPGIWKLEHAAKPLTVGTKSDPESQVARAMVAALRHKGGVVTLRLSPDGLGPVRVELRVEDGRVSATIDAQDERTRGALHGGLDSLRKSLEASGLSVDRLDVVGTVGVGLAPAEGTHTPQDHDRQPPPDSDAQDRHPDAWSGPGEHGGHSHEHGFEQDTPSESPDEGRIDLAWSLRTLRLDTVV